MNDDTDWDSRVCTAQDAGRRVRCCTALNANSGEAIAQWLQQHSGTFVPAGSIV
jgi:hypothetical protein